MLIQYKLLYWIVASDQRRISDVVRRMRSRISDERKNENRDKVSGANTRAIVFLVSSWTSNNDETNRIKDELKNLRSERPGEIFSKMFKLVNKVKRSERPREIFSKIFKLSFAILQSSSDHKNIYGGRFKIY